MFDAGSEYATTLVPHPDVFWYRSPKIMSKKFFQHFSDAYFFSIMVVTKNKTIKKTWNSAPAIYYVVGQKLKC